MEENHSFTTNHINIINFILLVCIFGLAFLGGLSFEAFVFSIVTCAFNLILMVVFILKQRPDIWVSNLVWLILLPIVGFGCCTFSLDAGAGLG